LTDKVLPFDPERELAGLGFETIQAVPGSTFADNSTVLVVPTRGVRGEDGILRPMLHRRVVESWQQMATPMNQKRGFFYAFGDEVGHAYNNLIHVILEHPELSKWKYVMTMEDDNIIPADAHVRLLESINFDGGFDAVSGIYFTKGPIAMPMAYGDPDERLRTGAIDFKPRDIRAALGGGHIMRVNGIAMGCALWRMDLFREIPAPWFVNVAEVVADGRGVALEHATQDLYFCRRATEAGKRFAVDFRVKVGHLDIETDVVY
jgi:hypothetical protein